MRKKPKQIELSQLFPLQGFWAIVTWIIILATLVTIWYYVPTYIWQYILLLRVPIVFGVFLFVFPILANTLASAMFQNLFVMRGRWQLPTVIVSSTMAGLMIAFVSALILANAPARFEIPQLITLPIKYQYVLTATLILPTWWVAIRLSTKELGKLVVFQRTIVGITSSFVLVWAINWLKSVLDSWQELKQFLAGWILLFAKHHPQGYLDSQDKLTTGHLIGIALAVVGLLVYVSVIYLYRPTRKQSLGEAPALLYALLLIWIGTLFLSGATFYSDYFHVPVIVFFVLFSALIYFLFGVDHFFRLKDIDTSLLDPNEAKDMVNFKKAIDERLKHQGQERTLVVVCASGGGIQAAGWTVQVLGGLQEELGSSFTQATGLISSASGGSVGTMYFLDRFDKQEGYPSFETEEDRRVENSLRFENATLNHIFNSTTQDSLDAVGWGLAYPDLVRGIGLPFLVNQYSDRAAAMEIDWQREMKQPETTLVDWRKQVLKGQIPIPVFNATLVEDGRRFLISPMTFIQDSEEQKAIDFNTLFNTKDGVPDPKFDINVTTAARLSATFPYVSPISRNSRNFQCNYHIADGGFFDNTGLFTAIEWLDEWLDKSKNLNVKRVLLLQINAFPKSLKSQLQPKTQGNEGWKMEWIGPLLALNSVRDSTQVARNWKETKLLKKRWKNEVEIEPYIIFFPEGYNQPLSWKLTEEQKKNLKSAWERVKRDSTFLEIKKLWQDKWKITQN